MSISQVRMWPSLPGSRVRRTFRTGALGLALSLLLATFVVPNSDAAASAWSQPLLLTRDSGNARYEAMAASQDGSRAIAVFEIQDPVTSLLTAYASIFTKHVWSAPHALTVAGHNAQYVAKPTMSADGKRAMVLLIDQENSTFASLPEVMSWNGSAWAAPKVLGPSSTGAIYAPSIALSSNGTTGVAAWAVSDGTPTYVVSTSLSNGTWSDATVLSAPDSSAGQPFAATSRDGKVQMIEFNQMTPGGVETKVVSRAADTWRPAVTLPTTATSSGGLVFAVSADGKHAGSLSTGKLTNGNALYYSQLSAGKWTTKQIAASAGEVYVPTLAMSSDASVVAVGFNTSVNSVATPTVILQTKGVWAKPTPLASSQLAGMMSVSVNPDGKRVTIAWYGQGGDPSVHLRIQFKTGPYWTAAFDPQAAGQAFDGSVVELSGDGAITFVLAANRPSDTIRDVWARTWTAPPTLASVLPAVGTTKGGNKTTIKGTALLGATVFIGGKKARVVSGTSAALTVLVPAHKIGKVSITVTTVGGSASKAKAYTYKK